MSFSDSTSRGFARGAAVDALKEEISRLRAENDELRREVASAHVTAATAKVQRIKALEEELIEQARLSARQISDLRMRIFEVESGVAKDGLSRGPAAVEARNMVPAGGQMEYIPSTMEHPFNNHNERGAAYDGSMPAPGGNYGFVNT